MLTAHGLIETQDPKQQLIPWGGEGQISKENSKAI